MSDAEKAIVRADCAEIRERMEELRAIPGFWNGLCQDRRDEFKMFFASVILYENSAQ